MRHFNGNIDVSQRALRRLAAKHGLKLPEFGDTSLSDMSWAALHESRLQLRHLSNDLERAVGSQEAFKGEASEAMDYLVHLITLRTDEIDARQAHGQREPNDPIRGASRKPANESAEWRSADGQPVHVLRPNQRVSDFVRSEELDREVGNLGQFCRAMVMGPRNEAEKRALSEGTDGAGGYTVNPTLSSAIIDRMRAKMRIMQAGAQTVLMDSKELKIVKIATDPTASMHTENVQESASDMTFEQLTFTARTMMAMVRASREMLDDSVNANDAIMMAFANAMAGEMDRLCIYGSGSAPEPRGLEFISGIGDVSPQVTLTDYDPILTGVQQILMANGRMPTAALMNPRKYIDLAKLKDTQGRYLDKPELIRELPFLETTQVEADEGGSPALTSIWIGDYTEMMVAVRASLRVELLKERFADFLQYGFLAWLRFDVQVKHPGSFARVRLDA